MTTVTQLASSDALVRQNTPNQNWASTTYLIAGVPVGNFFYSYLYFNRPFPIGATIVSAKLVLRQKGAATGGSRTVSVKRLAAGYSESKLTYANAPGVTGAAASLAQGNSAVDGRLWEIDVTAIMQAVSDGAAWFGLRVEANLTTPINFYSRDASINQPTLEIVWSDAPDAPTVLAPSNGRAVSLARPTLRFDFTDVAGDTSMQAFQVQMNATNVWTAPTKDTGTVAANVPEWLLDFDVAAAATWWWRVRVQDGAGVWSNWSAGTSFTRTAKPTLTITNPAASPNDFVSESTPPISWTATGQVSYQVFITDPLDPTEVLWTSGKVTSTDNSITLPDLPTPILSPGGTYNVVVRVWDNVSRETTPGDPVYVEASRVFSFDLDASVNPVSAFTVTPDSPRHTATLSWTRATAPDFFTILRSVAGPGSELVTVAQNLEPADLLVSGTTYEYVDGSASPRGAGHEWSAIAVENGVSSDSNPTDTAILEPTGVWLSRPDGSDAVCISGADAHTAEPSEDSSIRYALGAANPILITQAIHGRIGHIAGFLTGDMVDLGSPTAAEWSALFDALRYPPGQTLNLVLSDTSMKVLIFKTYTGVADEIEGDIPHLVRLLRAALMLALGLTAVEHTEYLDTLARAHEIKVTIQILDNQHAVISTVTAILLDGQVDMTADIGKGDDMRVSRVATLQLLDPSRSMTFDSDSPVDGAMYLDRMIRIIYSVRCPSRWVDVPVFTGPVTKCDRDGDIVNVEAHGKEEFGLESAFNTLTYRGRKTDAIKFILARTGEIPKYMEIPDSTVPLATPVSVGRESKLWGKAFGVAASMNRHLYYDGRGISKSVELSATPAALIRSGEGGLLLTDPQISYDTENLFNAWRIVGSKPKGAKAPVEATVVAPRSHPLSPYRIGRNGFPRYLLKTEENSDFRSKPACLARANALMKIDLAQQVTATYECAPMPHLEPIDMVTVTTDHFTLPHRPSELSLPLVHDRNMPVGYLKKLTKPTRPVRSA